MRKALTIVFLAQMISMLSIAGPVMARDATEIPITALQAAPEEMSPPRPALPDTYGGAQVSYHMIPSSSFFPYNSSAQDYASDNFGRGPRWTTAGGHDMLAPIHLPAGAQIVYMELDYIDNSPTGQVFASVTRCDWTGASCQFHPTTNPACIAGFICSGAAEASPNIGVTSIDLTPDNLFVDNFNVQFGVLVEPNTSDGLTKVAGVIIGYKLRVSPAPVSATFIDVPTTHPFFRFVEALVAAGITGGCGSGMYCVDSPVTRGQMAVFLASALGLQFH